MGENNNNLDQGAPAEPVDVESNPKEPAPNEGNTAAVISLLNLVKQTVDGSKQQVFDETARVMSAEIIQDRVKLTLKGVDRFKAAQKEVREAEKGDVVTYVNGVKQAVQSQAQFDKLKKAKESFQKISKAMDLALNNNDFSKLAELCK